MITAVVLAAGASTRFGSPKQRLLLGPVLERVRASDVDEIVETLVSDLRAGDVVAIMSNGAFGGIHEKLLAALNRRECERKPALLFFEDLPVKRLEILQ